jgi:hypothetical protein
MATLRIVTNVKTSGEDAKRIKIVAEYIYKSKATISVYINKEKIRSQYFKKYQLTFLLRKLISEVESHAFKEGEGDFSLNATIKPDNPNRAPFHIYSGQRFSFSAFCMLLGKLEYVMDEVENELESAEDDKCVCVCPPCECLCDCFCEHKCVCGCKCSECYVYDPNVEGAIKFDVSKGIGGLEEFVKKIHGMSNYVQKEGASVSNRYFEKK